jgi:hypothetical protein
MTDTEYDDEPRTERLEVARTGVARVNLLPPEIARERRAQRNAVISAGVLIIYLVVLGGVYVMKLGDVADARAERDAAAAAVNELQGQVAALAEFQQLVDDTASRETLLTAAMENEVSWARVFGGLALSFDADSSLTELNATTTEALEGIAADPAAVEEPAPDAPVGQIQFTGYSVERVAPGVREVLLKVTEGEGLFDSYLVTTAEEERGSDVVTTFEARVDLGNEIRSNRYDDGLPQESLE